MTIQRMIELLEIEHECILCNSHDDCDRKCADCDLVQEDDELHEMYTDVIALLKKQPEIIRCKYCVFRDPRDGMCEHVLQIRDPDWYCADGVRRNDDG